MSPRLTEAVRSLERAMETAKRRLEEIERERTEIKASLKSLNAALKTLTPGENARPTRKAATTAEVVTFFEGLLASGEAVALEEVTEQLRDQLHKQGKSRAGLTLRIEQALRDQRFERTQTGVRLRRGSP